VLVRGKGLGMGVNAKRPEDRRPNLAEELTKILPKSDTVRVNYAPGTIVGIFGVVYIIWSIFEPHT
jgi:hypothetical protein